MSESGVLQIITLVISSLTGFGMLWLKGQLDKNTKDTNDVNNKVNTVLMQNTQQTKKLETIHSEVNGAVNELVDLKVKNELSGISQKISEALFIVNAIKTAEAKLQSQEPGIVKE